MSLPTYEEAMIGFAPQDLMPEESSVPRWTWKVIAQLLGPYLDGSQLAAFCIVSKECCTAFRRILWSNPFLIFKQKKQPTFKHYQFMYLSHKTPLEVRSLVQTLDFEQINYFGLDSRISTLSPSSPERRIRNIAYTTAWFFYCTKLFPRLRFAMMDHLPGIIYHKKVNQRLEQADPLDLFGSYSVSNAASPTVAVELSRMSPVLFSFYGVGRLTVFKDTVVASNILYLDLSWSKIGPAYSPSVNDVDFGNVRVLKLRGCHMGDSELQEWLHVASQTWLLDVRDNILTDRAIDYLLTFRVRSPLPQQDDTPDQPSDTHLYADTPEYIQQDGQRLSYVMSPRPCEKHQFVSYITESTSFQSSINGQILDESDPLLRGTGVTQLLIAGNRSSSRGAKRLLNANNRFQHLDVGSVEATDSHKFKPYTTVYAQLDPKTTEGLLRQSGTRIEVLRIHHSIITSTPTFIDPRSRINGFSLPLVKQAEELGEKLRSDFLAMQPPQRAFSPLQNYRITDLALTGLPTKSFGFTISRLIDFLEDCATQESILSKIRSSTRPNRRAPPLHRGLRTLRLEFLPEDTKEYSSGLSVSGDSDADTFLASSEGDFSFFGSDTMSSVSRRGSVATSEMEREAASPVSRRGSVMGGALDRSMAREVSTSVSRRGSVMGGAALERLDRSLAAMSVEQAASEPEDPPVYDGVLDVRKALADWRELNKDSWTGVIKIVQVKKSGQP